MNLYEKACKEWLKGCSCSVKGKPESCLECTKGFHDRIKNLAKREGYSEVDINVIMNKETMKKVAHYIEDLQGTSVNIPIIEIQPPNVIVKIQIYNGSDLLWESEDLSVSIGAAITLTNLQIQLPQLTIT